ncbi:MAG: hypothetical protein ACRCX4_12125 [Bacteroidales bacterium]
MKAEDFYSKDKDEIMMAFNALSNVTLDEKEIEGIHHFFSENKDMEYNDFLTAYKARYGNVLECYYRRKMYRHMLIIRVAALAFLISDIILALYILFRIFG